MKRLILTFLISFTLSLVFSPVISAAAQAEAPVVVIYHADTGGVSAGSQPPYTDGAPIVVITVYGPPAPVNPLVKPAPPIRTVKLRYNHKRTPRLTRR